MITCFAKLTARSELRRWSKESPQERQGKLGLFERSALQARQVFNKWIRTQMRMYADKNTHGTGRNLTMTK